MLAAIIGWLGTIGTFVAYVLVFRGHLFADSWRYGLLNALGGTLGGAAAVLYEAWPSAAANFVWAGVGFFTVATATKDLFSSPARLLRPGQHSPLPSEIRCPNAVASPADE